MREDGMSFPTISLHIRQTKDLNYEEGTVNVRIEGLKPTA